MIGPPGRWDLAALLIMCAALSAGCLGQHLYPPVPGPEPDRLLLAVQHVRSVSGPYDAWASAVVTRPNGSSQPVDHLQVWLRVGHLMQTAEATGRSEISVEIRLPVPASEEPKSYACASHKGRTWCAGDPAARQ
jgi:hypothetical protein